MGVLQLLAADETTVLWDFADTTGGANPGGVVTQLSGALDLGTLGTDLNIFRTAEPGGQKLGISDPPVEFTVQFMASAATYDLLVQGLGQLARWLRDPPGPLKWTQGSNARYMELLGAPVLPALLRGQATAGIVPLRKSSLGPIPVTLLRQPWMREAPETTSTSDTVANDPATDNRVYPLTIGGDLPTPARIRVQMDSGSAVERVLVGWRAQGAEASSVMADYLSDTGWAQLDATNRGWTVALSSGTASTVDTDASGGNAAVISSSQGDRLRRARLTRTTKFESLRGSWDVWGRFKSSAAAVWNVELQWGPSTASTPGFSEDPVELDTSSLGTPPAFGYVEKNLGDYFPEDVTFTGATLEWWAQRMSGTGNLSGDHLWLVPADDNATVIAPFGSAGSVLGKNLTSPPDEITSDPTWTAGTILGDTITLNDANDAAGTGPNTGTDLPDGRNRYTFTLTSTGAAPWECRVVNNTDNAEVISQTGGGGVHVVALEFDAVAAKNYQAQINNPTGAGNVQVSSIRHEFLPSLASGESFRTEPGARYAIDRLDSSGNLTGYLGVEGEIPAELEPGLNHLMLRADEVRLAGYADNENKKGRTMTVTVTFSPRYAL